MVATASATEWFRKFFSDFLRVKNKIGIFRLGVRVPAISLNTPINTLWESITYEDDSDIK
jgi:hypothetical protein